VFARETPSGWQTNRMAGEFPSFGMMFPRASSVALPTGRPDSLVRRFWFPVDSAALAVAREAARTVQLSRCTAAGRCLSHTPSVVIGGNGISGPTFVDNAAYREWAWTTFRADALDMETAAVAMVAWQNRVPYIAFRSLSDLAGGGEGSNEVPIRGALAADNSAALVIAYLKALPVR
jgi:adenosylhomocysteine nucleosidase